MKRRTRYKSVKELISRTTSKTFQKFFHEMRRHEDSLRKIYAKDKLHQHVPEEVGSFSQVHEGEKERRIVTFYRCSICMKDLTENEVKNLQKK